MYFNIWRKDLSLFFERFQSWRTNTRFYFFKIFILFVIINDIAFWFAIETTHPEIITSETELLHYTKVQVPVALLGALFDSLSLYITLVVVRHALLSRSNMLYISHLSIDMLIAIVATFWVLFVFSISGWLVSFIPIKSEIAKHESLEDRNKAYADRAVAAIKNPKGKEEMRNIYFGIIMGFSAMIPTCVHIFSALFSLRFFLGLKKYNKLRYIT
jgi:hypothetical protein